MSQSQEPNKSQRELVKCLYATAQILSSTHFNTYFGVPSSIRDGAERLVKMVYRDLQNAAARLCHDEMLLATHSAGGTITFASQTRAIAKKLERSAQFLETRLDTPLTQSEKEFDLRGETPVVIARISQYLSHANMSLYARSLHALNVRQQGAFLPDGELFYLDTLLDSIGTFVSANATLRNVHHLDVVEDVIQANLLNLTEAKSVHPYDLLIFVPKEAEEGETTWVCSKQDICIQSMQFYTKFFNGRVDPSTHFMIGKDETLDEECINVA